MADKPGFQIVFENRFHNSLLQAKLRLFQKKHWDSSDFRYVSVCFPFYYLLLSVILAGAWRDGRKVFSYLAALVILLFVMGQALRIWPLLRDGRGRYQTILEEMAGGSQGNVLLVGSDNDFRNKMVLSFYSRFLQGGKSIQYIDQGSWNGNPPEWLIMHSLDKSVEMTSRIEVSPGRTYRLVKTEKFSGNSGFSWFLYRDCHKGK